MPAIPMVPLQPEDPALQSIFAEVRARGIEMPVGRDGVVDHRLDTSLLCDISEDEAHLLPGLA